MDTKNQIIDRLGVLQLRTKGLQDDLHVLKEFVEENVANSIRATGTARNLEDTIDGPFFVTDRSLEASDMETPKVIEPTAPMPEAQKPVVPEPVAAKPESPKPVAPPTTAIADKKVPAPRAAKKEPAPTAIQPPLVSDTTKEKTAAGKQPTAPPRVPPTPPKPPTAKKRAQGAAGAPRPKRDWERFIGENLISKLGIAILVTGIGFFVKYAIDNEWINEVGRVLIGLLCGGLLLGFAHRTRKAFNSFSSVLVAGGISTFYFTIYLAFQEYNLFAQPVAFGIMILITGFAVLLSLSYNRQELAVIALLGGFASPLLVRTGDGNFMVLFAYLAILNVGMLVLAARKKWRTVHLISYGATILFFVTWVIQTLSAGKTPPAMAGITFAGIFFVQFFLATVLNNVRTRQKLSNLDFSLLLSNSALFYSAGMLLLLPDATREFQGLFTAFVGAFHLLFAYPLLRRAGSDRNLVYLLLGLALTFVTLAAPVQLEGNHITLFWAAEAVLLMWLSQRSGIRMMRYSSLALLPLTVISLLMDFNNIYFSTDPALQSLRPLLNRGFLTAAFTTGALSVWLFLVRSNSEDLFKGLSVKRTLQLGKPLLGMLAFGSGFMELLFQGNQYIPLDAARMLVNITYVYAGFAALCWWAYHNGTNSLRQPLIAFGILAAVLYMPFNSAVIADIRMAWLLGEGGGAGQFIFHYVLIALVVSVLRYVIRYVRENFNLRSNTGTVMVTVVALVGVYMASSELDHYVVLLGYSNGASVSALLSQSHKVGLPIVWGVCSFVMMIAGMRKSYKPLRILSLALFSITLLKLFIFDIRDVAPGGKIAAFICLGGLLLVISFLYQRLKTLVFGSDDQAAEAPAEA